MLTKQNKQYSQGGQSAFPIVALLVGATIWGLLWYPYRLLERAGVSGPAATVITYLVALLLGLAVFRSKIRTLRILDRETCLLVGIGLSAGWANLAYVLGVLHGEIMRVMLLFYLSPLWTIVFARFLLGEVLSVHGYLVIAFSLMGAIIMLWQPEGSLLPSSYADWMGISAGFMFALANVLSRKDQYHDVQLKSVAVWVGVALVAFGYSLFLPGLPVSVDASTYTFLLLLLVGLTVFALSLVVQYGLTHTPANQAIVIMLFELVVAAVAAYFLTDEAMTLREWAGGAMIVSASLFSARMNESNTAHAVLPVPPVLTPEIRFPIQISHKREMNMNHHVVFLERDSLKVEVRRPNFEHTYEEYAKTTPDQVVSHLQHATIAIINKVGLSEETLAQLPKLKMVAIAATGYDAVDIAACRRQGIAVANIRNYAIHTVPEHVFALVLALRRNLFAYRQEIEQGKWQKSEQFCLFTHEISELFGATIGIVGEGTIGRGTAAIAEGFGMRVLFAYHESPKKKDVVLTPFDQVLAESDILSLHCPLTPATRNLIGMNELRKMKRSALLINTARGGLVDEAALVQALNDGTIAGAGFDVLTTEPPRNGNPLLGLCRPNFILTPHVAWASTEAMRFLADQLIDNIEAWVAGKPQNLLT